MTSTAAVLAALTLVLAAGSGCAGEKDTGRATPSAAGHTDHGSDAGAAMSMPTVSDPPASADWSAADASYLTAMIGHHHQALTMADLAATRASDGRVRSLAAAIDAGQGREIIVMATWLVDHDLPEPTLDDLEHGTTMPGMLSTAQLDELAAADGATFDRLFLEDMIQHHQGAVGMAEDVLGTGEDQRVSELATEAIATQGAEIARMRDLLLQLP